MRIRRQFDFFNIGIILSLILLGAMTLKMMETQRKLETCQEIRYNSHVIADELRMSSEDLTRFCRTYVSTGDSVWEDSYFEVLDIRNGKKPRSDGRTIALIDSMKKLGFTKEEFKKLEKAEVHSNELVYTEQVAFHAMKGLFDDGTGRFTVKGKPNQELARRVMYDDNYHKAKAGIIKPINEFIVMIQERTANDVAFYNKRSLLYLQVIFSMIFLIAIITVLSYLTLKVRIIKKLDELKKAYTTIEESETQLKLKNELLYKEIERVNIANSIILKDKQKLDELNSSKDRFFSIIAHDLRGPLGIFVNYSELISEKVAEGDYNNLAEWIKNMHESSLRVNQLLNNLLIWAKTQSAGIMTNPVEFDILQLANSQMELFAAIATEKEIRVTLTGRSPIMVCADKDQIEFVIRNLLVNALKFTWREGSIDIKVYKRTDQVLQTRIVVSDTGVGISQEQKEKLFQIGESQSKKGTEGEGGTGLGLILCKEFVEKNQGNISVISKLGEGSKFIVDLP